MRNFGRENKSEKDLIRENSERQNNLEKEYEQARSALRNFEGVEIEKAVRKSEEDPVDHKPGYKLIGYTVGLLSDHLKTIGVDRLYLTSMSTNFSETVDNDNVIFKYKKEGYKDISSKKVVLCKFICKCIDKDDKDKVYFESEFGTIGPHPDFVKDDDLQLDLFE